MSDANPFTAAEFRAAHPDMTNWSADDYDTLLARMEVDEGSAAMASRNGWGIVGRRGIDHNQVVVTFAPRQSMLDRSRSRSTCSFTAEFLATLQLAG